MNLNRDNTYMEVEPVDIVCLVPIPMLFDFEFIKRVKSLYLFS